MTSFLTLGTSLMTMDDGNRRRTRQEYTGPSFGIALYIFDRRDQISDLLELQIPCSGDTKIDTLLSTYDFSMLLVS